MELEAAGAELEGVEELELALEAAARLREPELPLDSVVPGGDKSI